MNASEILPPPDSAFPQELAQLQRRTELEVERSIARKHYDNEIFKSPEETKAEATVSEKNQADAAVFGEEKNLMSCSEQELLLRCKRLERELRKQKAVVCRLEETQCTGPIHHSRDEVIDKQSQKDTSGSPEIEALKSTLNEMEKNNGQRANKSPRRSILERNRNMLEESVRQLEKELEQYRDKEQIIRSEKKDTR